MAEKRYYRINERWDVKRGEFFAVENPAVIISIETLVNIQKRAEQILGLQGAFAPFYEAGKSAGSEWVGAFKVKWGLKGREFIKALEEFYAELGWGKLSIQDLKGDELRVIVENSFMARIYGKATMPVCYFLTGYVAGMATELTGRKMDAEETKCLAKGDSYCEFVARPTEIERVIP